MRSRCSVIFVRLVVACLFPGLTAAANEDIVAAARQQIGVTIRYDRTYRVLAYPHERYPAQRQPDASIDHRRVPNLMTFFARRGFAQPISNAAADYAPGDIVAWSLGRGANEDDLLFRFPIIGHLRIK